MSMGVTNEVALGGFLFLWRKRSIVEEGPVPHCNLQERPAQIANAPMVQGRELDLRNPGPTSVRNQIGLNARRDGFVFCSLVWL